MGVYCILCISIIIVFISLIGVGVVILELFMILFKFFGDFVIVFWNEFEFLNVFDWLGIYLLLEFVDNYYIGYIFLFFVSGWEIGKGFYMFFVGKFV